MRQDTASKMLGAIARIGAIIRSGRQDFGDGLASRPAAPPGARAAYGPILEHLEAEVAVAERDLAAAEGAYAAAQRRCADLRRRRDEEASELYQLLAPLQRVLVTLPVLAGGDVVAGTPASAPALVEHAGCTVQLLGQLERDPPPPVCWVFLEAGEVAAELEARCRGLEALVEEIGVADAAVGPMRVEAARVFDRAGKVASAVAGAMEGLAGLGEDGGLAPHPGSCD